jgi:hypothetical protein
MDNIKVLRATDPFVANSHAFSIVASDSEVEYVFPSGVELFDKEGALKFALGYYGKKPKDADEWLELAKFNLDSYDFMPHASANQSSTTLEHFINDEEQALVDAKSTGIPRSVLSTRLEAAVSALTRSDDEIADYLADPTTEIPAEKRKLIIATLIAAAGTTDLNPWLMPWLNGETDMDAMGFKGLILSRPYNAQDVSLDSDAYKNYVEGDTE